MGKYNKEDHNMSASENEAEAVTKKSFNNYKNKRKRQVSFENEESPKKKNRGRSHRPKRNKTEGSMRQLMRHKELLKALCIQNQTDEGHAALFNALSNREFNTICKCVKDIIYDKGPMKGKLDDERFHHLKNTLSPYSDSLKKIAGTKLSIKAKKRLMSRQQKGGNAILAAVIGSLLPVAVNAVENWIWPSSSKK